MEANFTGSLGSRGAERGSCDSHGARATEAGRGENADGVGRERAERVERGFVVQSGEERDGGRSGKHGEAARKRPERVLSRVGSAKADQLR